MPANSMIYIFFSVFVFLATSLAFYRISRKAGMPAIISMLMFVPVVNLLVLILTGFMKWPSEMELESYRKKYGPLEKEKNGYDDLPVCVKCQTPVPHGTRNCVKCGWPDNYREFS